MGNKPSQQQLKDLATFAGRLDDIGRKNLERDLSRMTEKKRNEMISEISQRVNSVGTISKAPSDLERFKRTVQREVLSPLAQGLNMAAFGIPEAAMGKMAPDAARQVFQQPRSIPGVLLQGGAQLAGIVGGLPGKLGRFVAKSALPVKSSGLGLGAAGSAPGAISSFHRAQALGNIGRAAIEGGVMGGTVLTDLKKDVGQQVQQQAFQAGVGAMAGTAFAGLSKAASGIKRNILKKVPLDKRGSVFSYVKPKVKLSKKLSRLKSDNKIERDKAMSEIDDVISGLQENNENQLKVLNARIKSKTLENASQVQDDLLDVNKQLTDAYGSTIDDIAQYADDAGVQPRLGDIDDMFERTASEIEDAGLDDERVYRVIKRAHKKYKIVDDDGLMNLESGGDDIGEVLDPNTSIAFRDLQNDIKQITKIRSSGERAGTADAATNILRKNYMDMLMQTDETLVQRFGDLQNSYSKSVNVIKEGFRVFKPRRGRLGTKQGQNLIERAAKGEGQERALLEALEEGKTVGDVSIPGIRPVLKKSIEEIKEVENVKRVTDKLVKNQKIKKSIIQRKMDQRRMALERRRRTAEDIEGTPQGLERLKRVAENAVIGASAAAGTGAAIKFGTGGGDR